MRSFFVASAIAAACFFSWVYWLMRESPAHEPVLTLIGALYALLVSLVIGAIAWLLMWLASRSIGLGYGAKLEGEQ